MNQHRAILRSNALAAALLGIALFGVAVNAQAASAPERVVEASTVAKTSAKLLADKRSSPALRVTLPILAEAERAKLARSNDKFTTIGIGRTTAALQQGIQLSSLAWTNVGSTRYATIEIESTAAKALRIGVAGRRLPKGVTLFVYGAAAPDTIYGPYGSADPRGSESIQWLPAVEGDTARIELQIDGSTKIDDKMLVIPKISHLATSLRSDNLLKDLRDIGQAGSCNIDVACPPSTSTWVSHGLSVGKYIVTTQSGDSGSCTGTLVNTNTQTTPPNYFLTANHCVSTVAEATSMHFYWFFRRATCGGAAPTTVTETLGGATFIKTVPANDATLVQLNAAPPAGTVLAAWTTTSLNSSEAVVGLHHPRGDLMKYSAGTQQGFTSYSNDTINSSASHIRVQWNQGTTEGGSSGSALFNAGGQLVGTLHGGGASCSTLALPDWYGRFDQAYVGLQPWLTPGVGGPPSPEPPPPPTVIDLASGVAVSSSVTENDDKYYRIQTSASNTGLTVTLTNLSADADLYVYRDTLSNAPACESERFNALSETCTLTSTAATTWYIDVYGYEAANFTVTATVTDPTPTPPTPPPPPSNGGSGGGRFEFLFAVILSALLALRYLARHRATRLAGNR
ncbi:MAG TPA: serine protease [Steroidobacteraceae bacterium]|nr:serine protease [Steroidobacteraceae bacterium]